LNETPLLPAHRERGAQIGEFAGWRSPISFTTVRHEHAAVRSKAGIFDISHMTRVLVEGEGCQDFLQKVFTANVYKIKQGRMKYGLLLNQEAGIIDDATLYRMEEQSFLLVSNAATRSRVLDWLLQHRAAGVRVTDITAKTALLAIQGREAHTHLANLLGMSLQDMKWFSGRPLELGGRPALLTRSGYTGEDGFELFLLDGDAEYFKTVWDQLSSVVTPCGLAARDMLRLECGYPLYGQDIDESMSAVEARLTWAVDMGKDFIGKDALARRLERTPDKVLLGLRMEEAGIPRPHYKVFDSHGRDVGLITSGGISYSLNRGVALLHIDPALADEGVEVLVDIRGAKRRGSITLKPFVEFRMPR